MKHISYILTQSAALAALESAGVKPDRTDTRELPGGRAHEKPLPPLDVWLRGAVLNPDSTVDIHISIGSGVSEGHERIDLTKSTNPIDIAIAADMAQVDMAAGDDESVTTEVKPKKSKKAK